MVARIIERNSLDEVLQLLEKFNNQVLELLDNRNLEKILLIYLIL